MRASISSTSVKSASMVSASWYLRSFISWRRVTLCCSSSRAFLYSWFRSSVARMSCSCISASDLYACASSSARRREVWSELPLCASPRCASCKSRCSSMICRRMSSSSRCLPSARLCASCRELACKASARRARAKPATRLSHGTGLVSTLESSFTNSRMTLLFNGCPCRKETRTVSAVLPPVSASRSSHVKAVALTSAACRGFQSLAIARKWKTPRKVSKPSWTCTRFLSWARQSSEGVSTSMRRPRMPVRVR
mmetsp:Transcript_32683/g.76628  ORF Transcript_32683/g.76628 Transcript_32683/m.76628 type:complete len:253 (-) Transcript_32683:778-1536(-)